MKILLLGGTRFLGLSLLKKLSKKDFDVIVISRREVEGIKGVDFHKGEKNNLLQDLKGITFDAVIDYISYGLEDVEINHSLLSFRKYYFISTIWLTKIALNKAADAFITSVDEGKLNNLPKVTRRYLLGKLDAENFFYEKNRFEERYNIIRLPIIFGKKDHTKRIHYYIERVIDEYRILLLNGGQYEAQIGWDDDVANLLCKFIEKGGDDYLIWEALPSETIRIMDIFRHLEDNLGKKKTYLSKDIDFYNEYFPEYLDSEPLWREEFNAITDHNLFINNKVKSTNYELWLKKIMAEILKNEVINATEIRKNEVTLLNRL